MEYSKSFSFIFCEWFRVYVKMLCKHAPVSRVWLMQLFVLIIGYYKWFWKVLTKDIKTNVCLCV